MTDDGVGLDVSVLTEVLETGDAEARMVLARQLAGFLADPDASQLEQQQVLPVVLKLAVDEDEEVRRVLADELCSMSDLPADLLFAIVADREEISLPFIATTMCMHPNHMFAILRVGDDARQAVIARRPDITCDIAAYIIAHGKLGGCLALLDNATVQCSANDLRILFERFGNTPEMAEKLLSIPTLPSDIRITQLRRTASRMRQLMVESAWLPASHALDVVTDAEDSAVLRILVEANDNDIADTVSYLANKELLTPSLVVRAASRGEMRVIEILFAHLSGYSHERVRSMLSGQKASSFQTLFRKSGLPRTCLGIVQAACEVHAEVRRDGFDLDSEAFGRRILEALMTRYDVFSAPERQKQIEYLGRYAEGKVKRIAQRLRADFANAA
jgi:uncharacterized protein (DUF2336 family)